MRRAMDAGWLDCKGGRISTKEESERNVYSENYTEILRVPQHPVECIHVYLNMEYCDFLVVQHLGCGPLVGHRR